MGHVARISFEFRSRFWENLGAEKVGFLHADPIHDFPTWWTQMYQRTPVLIAWQGGPRAAELNRASIKMQIRRALATLSSLTRRSVRFLEDQMIAGHAHNWSTDPFARGAYSYLDVAGHQAFPPVNRE